MCVWVHLCVKCVYASACMCAGACVYKYICNESICVYSGTYKQMNIIKKREREESKRQTAVVSWAKLRLYRTQACSLLTRAELLATVTCRGRRWAGGCRHLTKERISHRHPAIKAKGILGSGSNIGWEVSCDWMSTFSSTWCSVHFLLHHHSSIKWGKFRKQWRRPCTGVWCRALLHGKRQVTKS